MSVPSVDDGIANLVEACSRLMDPSQVSAEQAEVEVEVENGARLQATEDVSKRGKMEQYVAVIIGGEEFQLSPALTHMGLKGGVRMANKIRGSAIWDMESPTALYNLGCRLQIYLCSRLEADSPFAKGFTRKEDTWSSEPIHVSQDESCDEAVKGLFDHHHANVDCKGIFFVASRDMEAYMRQEIQKTKRLALNTPLQRLGKITLKGLFGPLKALSLGAAFCPEAMATAAQAAAIAGESEDSRLFIPYRRERVPRNSAGQRVDGRLFSDDRAHYKVVTKLRLCNRHFLERHGCPKTDREKYPEGCTHTHDLPPGVVLKAKDLNALKLAMRRLPCDYGLLCPSADCLYGHNCPYNANRNCVRGDKCDFAKEMHLQDHKIVRCSGR